MDLLAELARLNADPSLVAGLEGMVRQLQEQVSSQSQQLSAQNHQIQSLELKNQKLVLELAHLKRMRFGTKSEALTSEQKILFEDDADQDLAAIQAELDTEEPAVDATAHRPRARAGRQPLPKHLERIEVRHELDACTCAHCQRELVKIGEDVWGSLIPADSSDCYH